MAQIESICKVTVLARGVASEGRARSHFALVSEPCCWRPRSIARGRGGSKSREGRSGVPVRVLPRCPVWWRAQAPCLGWVWRGGGSGRGAGLCQPGGRWLLSPRAICCPHLCRLRRGQASGQEVPESGVGRGREQAKLDLQYDKAKLITSRL